VKKYKYIITTILFLTLTFGYLFATKIIGPKNTQNLGGGFGTIQKIGSGGGTPGGSDTQLQYNNAGVFGGITGATTNGTTVTFADGGIKAHNILASTSAGFLLESNSGTDVALFGAGGGAGATFYGGVNIAGNLAVDTDVLFVDTTNNRLGVGTASPQKVLHVSSATDATIRLERTGGSATTFDISAGNSRLALGAGITITSNALGINQQSASGNLHVNTSSASTIGEIIQGFASQTANLSQWRNSANAILSVMTSDGRLGLGTSTVTTGFGLEVRDRGLLVNNSTGDGQMSIANGFGQGLRISTNGSSAGGSLQNYDGSATALTWSNGNVSIGTTSNLGRLGVVNSVPGTVASAIRGATSQTADLTQWQNSAGTVLAKIASNGDITGSSYLTVGLGALINSGTGGVSIGYHTSGGFDFGSAGTINWWSSGVGAGSKDIGMSRSSAGVLKVTNGSSGFGDLSTGRLISDNVVRLKGYTVATLPAGTTGDTAYVTDALAPTFLSTIVGGGAITTPVFYNGSNWVAQ
jgi:hypothetical protein